MKRWKVEMKIGNEVFYSIEVETQQEAMSRYVIMSRYAKMEPYRGVKVTDPYPVEYQQK